MIAQALSNKPPGDSSSTLNRSLTLMLFIAHSLSCTSQDGFVPVGFEIGDFIVVSVANSVLAKLKSRGREDLPAFLQKALESPVGLTGFVGADGHVHDDFLALLDAACEGTKVSDYKIYLRKAMILKTM